MNKKTQQQTYLLLAVQAASAGVKHMCAVQILFRYFTSVVFVKRNKKSTVVNQCQLKVEKPEKGSTCIDMNELSQSGLLKTEKTDRRCLVDRHWQRLWVNGGSK